MTYLSFKTVKHWDNEVLDLCQSYLPDHVEFLGVSNTAYCEISYNGEFQRFTHVTMMSGGIRHEGASPVSFKTKTAAWAAYDEQMEAYLADKTAVVWRWSPYIRETYPDYDLDDEKPPSDGFTVWSRLSAV